MARHYGYHLMTGTSPTLRMMAPFDAMAMQARQAVAGSLVLSSGYVKKL